MLNPALIQPLLNEEFLKDFLPGIILELESFKYIKSLNSIEEIYFNNSDEYQLKLYRQVKVNTKELSDKQVNAEEIAAEEVNTEKVKAEEIHLNKAILYYTDLNSRDIPNEYNLTDVMPEPKEIIFERTDLNTIKENYLKYLGEKQIENYKNYFQEKE